MGKDSYYFSHDSNARNDIKVIRLRRALGMEGYGIYFALIEMLREQENFQLPLEVLNDIAFDLHTSEEKVKAVVMSYELFSVENERFFSARLFRSMEELSAKRQKFIDSGRKGGEASLKRRLNVAQPLNKSKVNKSKEEDKNTIVFYRVIKHLKITTEEKDRLIIQGYSQQQVDDILDRIENYKKNTSYVSLYLTAKNWLEREYPIVKQMEIQDDFLNQL